MRILCFILLFINFSLGMGGKPAPLKKVVKLYKEDTSERKLAFIKFDNLSKIEDVENLSLDIPRSLYSFFDNKEYSITVSTNELKPQWKIQEAYERKAYSYYVEDPSKLSATVDIDTKEKSFSEKTLADIEKEETEKLDGTTDFNEKVKKEEEESSSSFKQTKVYMKNPETLRLWMNTNIINGYFFLKEEGTDDEKNKQVIFYTAKKDTIYIDAKASDFDPDLLIKNIKTNEFVIPSYNTNTRKRERVIFRETSFFKRKLTPHSQIMKINNARLEDIVSSLEKEDLDYAIYGHITKINTEQFEDKILQDAISSVGLKIFLVRAQTKSIELIYEGQIDPYSVYKELSHIPYITMAAIQNKNLVHNIQFEDDLGGSHVYLDGYFLGKTPLNIKSFPEGEYQLDIWNVGFEIDYESLAANNPNIIIEKEKNRDKVRAYIRISPQKGDKNITFNIIKKNKRGYAEISVENGEKSKLYVDSRLTSVFKRDTKLDMPVGNYYTSLNSDEHLEVKRFILPIKEDTITKVKVKYQPLLPENRLKKILFNHKRNYKVFAVMTFLSASTTMGMWGHSRTLLLKMKELEGIGKGAGSNYNTLSNQFNTYNTVYYSFIAVTVLFLVATFTARVMYIKEENYKMGLPTDNNEYFELEYIPIKSKSVEEN